MAIRVLVLQEKLENIANIELSLPDCELVHVGTVDQAIDRLTPEVDLIISAVHLEHDGSVFDFLKFTKGNPETSHIPFVFYCSQSTKFARSVRDGLQIAARAIGADKYVTMEIFDSMELRDQILEAIEDKLPPYVPATPESGVSTHKL